MTRWFPTTAYGALTPASFMGTGLEPIASYAPKILLPRGLHQVPRGFGRDPGGGDDHASGVGCKLTAAPLADTTEKYATGVSIDQVIAKAVNPMGKGALNLMVGYRNKDVLGCISYVGAGQQASPFQDPWKAFKDWVGSGGSGMTVVDKLAMRRKSVIDLCKRDVDLLNSSSALSSQDKQKLDLFLTNIRTVENTATTAGLPACNLPMARKAEIEAINPMTVTRDSEYEKIGGMMMDVMALALACDYNRVVTLQWGSGAGGPIFSWLQPALNTMYNHHKLSHGSTTDGGTMNTLPEADWRAALNNIDKWYATQLKSLLDKLSVVHRARRHAARQHERAVHERPRRRPGPQLDGPAADADRRHEGLLQAGPVHQDDGRHRHRQRQGRAHNQLLTTLANGMGVQMTNFGSAPTGKAGELTALKA